MLRTKLMKIPKSDFQKIVLRSRQSDLKRRQTYDPSRGSDGDDKKRSRGVGEMGNLGSFPYVTEECFLSYSCPVPELRVHKMVTPGIEDSEFPEQSIRLPNPNLLEPLVTMETKKLIFKPDADGNSRVRDEKVSLEKADIANKTMVPLSLMGRDEEYLKNMLWLMGASQVILWGVGNGMLAWVCLCLRIPILCVYENELHKETIQKHLLDKIEKAADDPSNKRFYKTNAELGVSDDKADKNKKPPTVPKKEDAPAVPKKDDAVPKKGKKSSSSSTQKSSSSSSSSSDKKKKKKKVKAGK